jgi:hypothetical protein
MTSARQRLGLPDVEMCVGALRIPKQIQVRLHFSSQHDAGQERLVQELLHERTRLGWDAFQKLRCSARS